MSPLARVVRMTLAPRRQGALARGTLPAVLAGLVALAGAGGAACGETCGPSSVTVATVIDGDTVDLEGGERVRYLGIDAPEIHDPVECYGPEAEQYNRDLVEGQQVSLEYDTECRDAYGRLLAFVKIGGRMVNRLMVERGYARVLVIEPNVKYAEEFNELEQQARASGAGLWGVCR